MSKEEILTGLKQAIQRGYSLEIAKQSFVNAGYNPQEVEEAASEISGVLTKYPQFSQPQPQNQIPIIQRQPIIQVQQPKPQQFSAQIQPEKSKTKIFIIILALILLILIAGLIASIFFKEKIIEFINQLL